MSKKLTQAQLLSKFITKHRTELQKEIRKTYNGMIDRPQYLRGLSALPHLQQKARDMGIKFCTYCGHRPIKEGNRWLCVWCWQHADDGLDDPARAGGYAVNQVDSS